MFDLYKFVWGTVKYTVPILLFIVAVFVTKDMLLLIVSLLWIAASIIVSVLALSDEKTTAIEPRY